MTHPAVRSALVGIAAVTLAALLAAGLHLAAQQRQAGAAAADVLRAHAEAEATVLATQAGTPAAATRIAAAFIPFAALDDGIERVLTDDAGTVYAASDADLGRAVDWAVATRRAGGGRLADLTVGTATYRVAAAPVGGTGMVVATAARAQGAWTGVRETLVWTFVLWGLVVGLLVLRARADGPRTVERLTAFGERIATGDTDAASLRRASAGLGPLVQAFAPVAARLRREAEERSGLREHVSALYQVNPSPVLLATLDGRLVEANPAFYAATGMPPEVIRDGHAAVLDEVFPLTPLLDLAQRSLAEGASIGGIDYGLVSADDGAHPVEVSLRAFRLGETDAVVIQATDLAVRRRLEGRVEAFTDTLDLMVDQRVQQLTAGQQSLRRILDAAGVAVASFDAGGNTRRWSGGARALTGRTVRDVPHFAAVAAALGLSDTDRALFTAWFWNPGTAPFLALHTVADASGRLRAHRVAWHRVEADVPGRADARTLVGAPIPAAVPDNAAGDGFAGQVPEPARGRA